MTGSDIDLAAGLLAQGKLVAIPTETVYGLAANALNADAVIRIFEAKNRPTFDPLIIHVASLEDAQKYALDIPPLAMQLASAFWPGPLTLVLPKRNIIPDVVTSGLDAVAIRVPAHPITLRLLEKIDFPLAAPSANPFGYVSPTEARHVEKQLGNKTDYILDGGACNVGIESTIVSFTDGVPKVLRLGGLPVDDIEEITGTLQLELSNNSNPAAPGQLDKHYAPLKPLYFGDIDKMIAENNQKSIGIISYSKPYDGFANEILSASGDLHEATRNLFRAIRNLDASPVEVILAEPVPTHGLGAAINDRLRRASVN